MPRDTSIKITFKTPPPKSNYGGDPFDPYARLEGVDLEDVVPDLEDVVPRVNRVMQALGISFEEFSRAITQVTDEVDDEVDD